VNGIEAANRAATGTLAPSPEPVYIGRLFVGSLDEVEIYRRALTPSEIIADMTAVGCSFTMSPSSLSPGETGGTGVISVTANLWACAWSAQSQATWTAIGTRLYGYAAQVLVDGAVGYWRLDEASGTSLADRRGEGLTAAVNGTVTLQQNGALADGN